MSCTICGKATGPGALLCRPCKSALKRARQFTVLELPGTPATVTMPGLAHDLHRARPTAPVRLTRRRAHAKALQPAALIVGALLAIGAFAFVGQQLRDVDEPEVDPQPAPHVTAPARATAPSLDPAANPERSAEIAPAPPRPRPPAIAKVPAKVVPLTPAPLTMRAEAAIPDSPPGSATAIAVEAPKLAPPVAPVTQPLDRWQSMADAFAGCAREGGLTGFICHQRVRLDSCEGHWGRVPQCSLPPENPR